MDVCVVGAGVIGSAVAYHLAKRGADVTIVESTLRPEGASMATFGWINANAKQPTHYFELNRAGMDAHAKLAHDLGDAGWLHGGGSIEWPEPTGMAALHERVELCQTAGYPAELVQPSRLVALEPSLRAPPPTVGAYFPSEGWADAVELIRLLLAAAEATGATVLLGRRVAGLDEAQSGRVEVVLDDYSKVGADVVVNCAGADAGPFGSAAGIAVNTAGPPGVNALSAPLGMPPKRVVRAPGVHFRPDRGGRVLISSPAVDKELAAGTPATELATRLIEAAQTYVPELAGVAVEDVRVARRAIPPDGLPIVGRTLTAPWLYHVVTHSGVTLAPLLGRIAAAEIIGDAEEALLSPYRPDRFARSLIS